MDTFFTNRYYRINRRLLLIVGVWPHSDARISQIRRILVYIGFMVIIISQILALVTSDLSLKVVIEVLASLIPSFFTLTAYISTYYHGKMMLEHIRYDWYDFTTVEEQEILEKYANLIRTATITACILLAIGISWYMLPLTLMYILDILAPLNETRANELPFRVELFIDQQEHFLFFILLTYASTIFIAVTSLGPFLLLVTYWMHACGMLEIVGEMLKHLFDIETYDSCTPKDMENIMTRLIRYVSFHDRTSRFIYTVNSVYKMSSLVQVILAFVVISIGFIQIFYLKNITENMKECFMAVSYIINTFVWLFLYSSTGQILLNKNKDLVDNAYAASWYMVPNKMQKLLIMILMKAMRYTSLDVGGVIKVSLNFFTGMIQNAMSYAMIMHSLR